MFRVGLTGGIGSGKSTVARLFAGLGVPVFDADEIGRALLSPGRDGFRQVVARFGPEVLLPDGSLDRRGLRTRLAIEPTTRRELETILHPLIRGEMESLTEAADGSGYCLWVVPLLLEAGWRDAVERVLVVDLPIELQVQRTVSRDAVGEPEVRGMIAAQIPRERRLTAADDVIVNEGSVAQLESQVGMLHQKYLALAASPGT